MLHKTFKRDCHSVFVLHISCVCVCFVCVCSIVLVQDVIGCDEMSEQPGLVELVLEFDVVVVVENAMIQLFMMQYFSMLMTLSCNVSVQYVVILLF